MSDLISRQAAIALANSLKDDLPDDERIADTVMAHNEGILEYQTKLSLLPSTEPEMNFDEWCTDCKEYNHKRHCCPRWNRVIRQTLKDAQPEPQWIPVSERLPEEKEFVLVTFGWFGRKTDPEVNIDEMRDGDWMISEVVTAWMPLPEPYSAERRTDDQSK